MSEHIFVPNAIQIFLDIKRLSISTDLYFFQNIKETSRKLLNTLFDGQEETHESLNINKK